MKKRIFFLLIALACALFCIVGIDLYAKTQIDNNIAKAVYYNNYYTRNCSDYVMDQIIDENSIAVLGSSELSSMDDLAYPYALFNYGYSDFNMILIGGAYFQSILQSINLGAMENNIKNGKVVLILSPQWFTASGLTSGQFCSRYEETNFVEFLKNDSISKPLRIAVANRVNAQLVSDPPALARAEKDEQVYLYHSLNPLTHLEMATYNCFINAKLRLEIAKQLQAEPLRMDPDRYVIAEDIDWNDIMVRAEALGVESCTNNPFGVYDDYYNTYMADGIDARKNSYSGQSYAESPEYDDLRLFLDICKDIEIEPLIISVPVNGRWYDYCAFSKADRNTYYQNIRDICAEYDVQLVDFSTKEYEIYFLRDIMHMGWKGWTYLNRAVFEFYSDQPITDTTTYEILRPKSSTLSDGAVLGADGSYSLADCEHTDTVTVSLQEKQMELDHTSDAEHRIGTYLHTEESGDYVIRIASSSAYVDVTFALEKDAVYKLEYDVIDLEGEQVAVDAFTLSEISY